MRLMFIVALAALVVACGPAPAPAAAPAPKPAEPAQAAPKPAAPVAPPAAQPAKPAAQPAKPAAEVPKPAAQPAKPAAAAPSRLTMGTSGAASSYYAYTVGLAKALQEKIPGLNVTVSEGGGTTLNARRLVDGKIDFSLTSFGALYPLYTGLDPQWKDNPMKEARSLWVFDPATHVWFVREDSGVSSFEQLQGKDFAAGGKGSGTETIGRLLVFPAIGLQARWYTGGMDDARDAVKDRRIVGMGKATALKAPDALIQEVMTTTKIRILSWPPALVQKVKAQHPGLGTVEIPAGVYKAEWNEKPITSWGDGIGMYALAKFSDDLAYRFTKAAVEDSKASGGHQVAAYKGMTGVDVPKATLDLATVPLHAGAQKYYQEIGQKIPDQVKSPEAK
ncbi:MAG: TAXI family TRAP transporter solute-binding subunit [Chloroflexi bacterium]|nr:TAXI family TRAP transporter solute-binding subunit [Chloroflexota bacterium]